MKDRLGHYIETHGSGEPPLLALRGFVERHGPPTDADLAALAERSGLPVARLRGAASYFADLRADPGATRICVGTSCRLAGAASLESELAAEGPSRTAHCLGYCDRSPARLSPQGEIALRAGAPAPPGSDVRCLAREPIVTARIARGDHASLEVARAAGAYRALERVVRMRPEDVVAELEASGERGRGGAGFPTGTKWRRCAEVVSDARCIVANGDEGDPGSFIDRLLMELDPHAVLEGLAIGAYAIGAGRGLVYVRSEYPRADRVLRRAIEEARGAGILGPSVLGSGFAFDASVFPGMGSYVCGEETALLSAIEGKRGEVRLRPPYPVVEGLHGEPTVVDNVETLVSVPWILERGPDAFRAFGTEVSTGTKAMCLGHGFARPGVVEVEFGTPLARVIEEGAPTSLAAVLLGGPMGSLVLPDAWDVPIGFDAMSARGIALGHGGIVGIPVDASFRDLLLHLLDFVRSESCGKCVPCRVGSERAAEIAVAGIDETGRRRLDGIFDVMASASLCAFGRDTPRPIRQLLDAFGDRIAGESA